MREGWNSKRVVIGTTDEGKEIFWNMPIPPPLSMKPVEEVVQRETSVALEEYTQICLDKRRRFALWLLCYFDPYQPQAVNEARAAKAVEDGWDYGWERK